MPRAERNRSPVAVALWSGLIVATTVLLSRRMAGELSPPTSAWPAVLTSSFATILSLTAWAFCQRTRMLLTEARVEWLAASVAWCPTWLCGLAVAPANSTLAQGWLIGVALLSASLLALLSYWNHAARFQPAAFRTADNQTAPPPPPVARRLEPTPSRPDGIPPPVTESALTVFDPITEEPSAGMITQRMTRQTLPDGVEQLEGCVRVPFVAGQRAASVHVPFSPPFAAVPQVECEVTGNEAARWKLSVLYPYGMRIEIKRGASEDAAEIELAYSAICETSQSDAA